MKILLFTLGWLFALLHPLALDHQLVVSPVIDRLNKDTFVFEAASQNVIGNFNFRLRFGWTDVARDVMKDLESNPAKRLRYVAQYVLNRFLLGRFDFMHASVILVLMYCT